MAPVSGHVRAGPTVLPAGLKEAEANVRWLAEHPEIIREHRGEWICIADQRLVAAEAHEDIFAEKAKPFSDRDGAYILRVPTLDELEAAHPVPHPF